jgi:hypothetical protein
VRATIVRVLHDAEEWVLPDTNHEGEDEIKVDTKDDEDDGFDEGDHVEVTCLLIEDESPCVLELHSDVTALKEKEGINSK